MEFNWMALILSIVKNKTVDESLNLMKIKPDRRQVQKLELSDEDFELILFLKENHTWNEIASEFGVTANYMSQLCYYNKKNKAIKEETTNSQTLITFRKKSITL